MATEAAVCCKPEVVVRHGLSKFERVVREVAADAAVACDARASAMAARCMKSTVDVFPLGLCRPSHVSVNRKSICSDR